MIRKWGRLLAPDQNDHRYLIADMPRPVSVGETHRYWNAEGWWGDQRDQPQCVAYAWTHWLEDGPITHAGPVPMIEPEWLYNEAQSRDPWRGTPHEGTTVRAAAEVLRSVGLIREYRWAFKLDHLVSALLHHGPVVIGTNWYSDMNTPDETGHIRVRGELQGGHSTKLDGVNTESQLFRGKNNWNRGWSRQGFYTISFEDMERLLHEDGEVCLAVEAPSA